MENSNTGRHKLSLDQHFEGVRAGKVAVLARTLTLIESSNPFHQKQAEELLTRLLPYSGNAIRIGITGAPGVGKSTFIEAFGLYLVSIGKRVAVLAVDPSSGISGGSILGDKTRMPELSAHGQAYIRPAPSAGTLGGVANRTRESMLVCEAAGYDVVLVETVGVGQSETVVADMTDCFLALMLPGAGDELQGIKRGLLELVDVIAVNKADGETKAAAEYAAHQYEIVLKSITGHSPLKMPPDVLTCSALKRKGIEEVWQTIEHRYQQQLDAGNLSKIRTKQNLRWMWTLVEQDIQQQIRNHSEVNSMREKLERDVTSGAITPKTAARNILLALGFEPEN